MIGIKPTPFGLRVLKCNTLNLAIWNPLAEFLFKFLHQFAAQNIQWLSSSWSIKNSQYKGKCRCFSLKSLQVQQTLQLTPLKRNSLLDDLISSVKNSGHFLQVMSFSLFSSFCSTRYPITAGGQRQYGKRGFFYAQHLHTWIFNDLRELLNLPCATICVRQTGGLYQQVLPCHSGSAVGSTRPTRQGHHIYALSEALRGTTFYLLGNHMAYNRDVIKTNMKIYCDYFRTSKLGWYELPSCCLYLNYSTNRVKVYTRVCKVRFCKINVFFGMCYKQITICQAAYVKPASTVSHSSLHYIITGGNYDNFIPNICKWFPIYSVTCKSIGLDQVVAFFCIT